MNIDRKEYMKEYYIQNKERLKQHYRQYMQTPEAKEKKNAREAKYRKQRKDKINLIKITSGCIDCGFNKHPSALHFDHVENDKESEVAKLVADGRSWERIIKEVEKCVVRCANCHAIKTWSP